MRVSATRQQHRRTERIVAVWEAVDQRVIDAAIRQWRQRLLARVKAKGGIF